MILTGSEIAKRREAGEITIDPFDGGRLSPNSYDLTLCDKLLTYDLREGPRLDMRREQATVSHSIPRHGMMLHPGVLYLGGTVERCGSDHFVTCIEGRSSVGRLGVSVHITAGFGDLGFGGRDPETGEIKGGFWTLEITVVHPIRVYAGVRICQAYFIVAAGDITKRYSGKYNDQLGPTPSRLWMDFAAREE